MNYFSPADSALVLIDHQVGTMGLIKNHALDMVRRNTLALARMALILDMPVVLTTSQEDQFQGPLMKELEEVLPQAHAARIKRAGLVNAWDDPAFAGAVRATGRSNLILAGVTTDVCLVFPAISARSEGFDVQAVLDASGSPFGLSEEMARRRMELAGVILTATITVFAELAHDWSSKEGTQLQKLLLEEVLAGVPG
ncbi:isochorismatase family protein [Massilia scottii]|uniref:isochorismatase family protein n=1 Tax=Massilia scottii TaxID=3057166 RepID=UPI002796B36A|nr:isochorismatase family protein [Massilia sp. CCM 9029]MDQ1831832.1 isochorismatase family protein [Massilia sp. CCM 9029]